MSDIFRHLILRAGRRLGGSEGTVASSAIAIMHRLTSRDMIWLALAVTIGLWWCYDRVAAQNARHELEIGETMREAQIMWNHREEAELRLALVRQWETCSGERDSADGTGRSK